MVQENNHQQGPNPSPEEPQQNPQDALARARGVVSAELKKALDKHPDWRNYTIEQLVANLQPYEAAILLDIINHPRPEITATLANGTTVNATLTSIKPSRIKIEDFASYLHFASAGAGVHQLQTDAFLAGALSNVSRVSGSDVRYTAQQVRDTDVNVTVRPYNMTAVARDGGIDIVKTEPTPAISAKLRVGGAFDEYLHRQIVPNGGLPQRLYTPSVDVEIVENGITIPTNTIEKFGLGDPLKAVRAIPSSDVSPSAQTVRVGTITDYVNTWGVLVDDKTVATSGYGIGVDPTFNALLGKEGYTVPIDIRYTGTVNDLAAIVNELYDEDNVKVPADDALAAMEVLGRLHQLQKEFVVGAPLGVEDVKLIAPPPPPVIQRTDSGPANDNGQMRQAG